VYDRGNSEFNQRLKGCQGGRHRNSSHKDRHQSNGRAVRESL